MNREALIASIAEKSGRSAADVDDALELVLREIGSDIIAVDGTDRNNCNGRKAYELIREIKETSQRLAVARQLDAGKSYSAIEEATGASAV